MHNRLAGYPNAASGLALGIGSIGIFWDYQIAPLPLFATIGAAIALLLIIPLILKFIRYPHVLKSALIHPISGSTLPTLAMTSMVISRTINLFSYHTAYAVWIAALLIHVIFYMAFLYNRIIEFRMHHLLPSWYVPPIGLVVACLTAPQNIPLLFLEMLLYFGIFSYFIMLPMMLYRLILKKALNELEKPTLAILAAPPSLCIAGYLTVTTTHIPLIVLLLFSFAILMTITVYCALYDLLKLKFSPAYSCYTFPLAIGATAMYKMSHWADTTSFLSCYAPYFYWISIVEGIIATVMILLVLLGYIKLVITLLHHPKQPEHPTPSQNNTD